jgi:hypothetical protein
VEVAVALRPVTPALSYNDRRRRGTDRTRLRT